MMSLIWSSNQRLCVVNPSMESIQTDYIRAPAIMTQAEHLRTNKHLAREQEADGEKWSFPSLYLFLADAHIEHLLLVPSDCGSAIDIEHLVQALTPRPSRICMYHPTMSKLGNLGVIRVPWTMHELRASLRAYRPDLNTAARIVQCPVQVKNEVVTHIVIPMHASPVKNGLIPLLAKLIALQ